MGCAHAGPGMIPASPRCSLTNGRHCRCDCNTLLIKCEFRKLREFAPAQQPIIAVHSAVTLLEVWLHLIERVQRTSRCERDRGEDMDKEE